MQREKVKNQISLSIGTRICVVLLLVLGITGTVTACGSGSSESDYGNDNYMVNWQSVSDAGLDGQIAQETAVLDQLNQDQKAFEKTLTDKTVETQILQENILIFNLNQEKSALETALQDKTLDEKTVQDKTTQMTAVKDKIATETAKLSTLMQDKSVNTRALQDKTTQLTALQDKISKESAKLNNLAQEKSVQSSMYQASVVTTGGGMSGLKVKFAKSFKTPPGAGVLSYMVSPYNSKNLAEQKTAVAKAFEKVQIVYSPEEKLKACSERLGLYMCTKGTKVAF